MFIFSCGKLVLQIANGFVYATLSLNRLARRILTICKKSLKRASNSGPFHTNPFSNENRALLLRFQKYLRPHAPFSYRFRSSTLQSRSREKADGSICPAFWILKVEWFGARSCLFDDVTVFSPFTLENSVFKSLLSRERFRMAPFSVIVFGVVVWTIAVSGAEQPRFRLKTD